MASTVPSFINMRSTGNSGYLTRYDDGRILSVWTDFDRAGGAYVYGKVFNADGTAAGGHFLIDSAASASYREITAETLADGRTVVAWVRSDGSGPAIVGKVLDKSFAPSSPLLLLSLDVESEETPQLHAQDGGGFTLVYRGAYNTIDAVYGETFIEQAGTWTSAAFTRVHNGPNNPSNSTIALRDGRFAVADAEQGENGTVLNVHLWTGQAWRTIEVDTIPGVTSGINPAISALADGGFVVAWEDRPDVPNPPPVIRIQAFDSAGNATGDTIGFLKPLGTLDGTPVIEQLQNGGIPSGFAIAFVMADANGGKDVYTAALSLQGDVIVGPTRVGTNAAGNQWDPSITVLADNTYAVSWQSDDENHSSFRQYIVDVVGREGTDVTTPIIPGGTDGPGEPPPPPPPPPPGPTWTGTEGNDAHTGSSLSETFYGLGGKDKIRAGGGNDTVDGGTGNDKIWGGTGNDVLMGRDGFDIFIFDTKPNKSTNKDHIADFGNLFDNIWLDNKVFTKLGKKGSEKSPAMIKKSMFALEKAKDKDDYIIYSKKKATIYYDADGSGSKVKAVEIATVKKGATVTHWDFFVI